MFLYQPPQPERTVQRIRQGPRVSRQEETLKHLAEGWIPANPSVLKAIDAELAQGLYKENRDALLEKVKADPGMFMHCARGIQMLGYSELHGIHPLDALRSIEYEQLKTLLEKATAQYTTHHFREATKHQNLRTQHSLIAVHTAEDLAQSANLKGEVACSAAMFTELGSNLIAWNFPHVYAQVMGRHRKNGENIEEVFEKLLGISASRIGARFASEWGIASDIREALTEVGVSGSEKLVSLREICKVASLIASAEDSFNFPEAKTALKNLESPIKALITPELISRVEEKVNAIVHQYTRPDDSLRSLPLVEKKTAKLSLDKADLLFSKNPFILRCSEEIQDIFLSVYRLADTDNVSITALKELTRKVAPDIGFPRGCLYLLSAKTGALEPALQFGEIPLAEYKEFRLRLADTISGSLYSHAPLRKVGEGVQGDFVSQIISSLEHSRYEGVLYLEEIKRDSDISAVLHFQAVRRALNQLLGDA